MDAINPTFELIEQAQIIYLLKDKITKMNMNLIILREGLDGYVPIEPIQIIYKTNACERYFSTLTIYLSSSHL